MISTDSQLIAGIIRYPLDFNKDASTAEAAGIKHSLWYSTGNPAAGAAPGGGLNGATFTAPLTGSIVGLPTLVTGEEVDLYNLEAMQGGNVGTLEIYDRIWGNVPVVTTTGAQAVTSPAWPSRDAAGSTLGTQVRLFMEVSATTGNGAPITNSTVSYTNSAGTAGRTATFVSVPTTAQTGTWVAANMAAGDDGCRSVQSVTLGTSYVSGTLHIIAARLIARIGLPTTFISYTKDFTQFGLPAAFDGSVLGLVVMPSGTAVGTVSGSLTFAQG